MSKTLAAIALAFALSACAAPARVDQMTVASPPAGAAVPDTALHSAVQVGDVTGGHDTNPLWKSEVGNSEFKGALEGSLKAEGVSADPRARYRLDANLVELDQPWIGLNLTVRSTVEYKLMEIATNSVAYDQRVTAEYTATVGDAFVAVERLRLANEGSIRKNISDFLKALTLAFPPKADGKPTS